MIAPAEFVINPSGRIEVMLGTHLVGVVEPWDGMQGRHGGSRVGAYFQITLPIDGHSGMKRPTASVAIARRLVLQRLADWFAAAGPCCQPLAEALALQAEDERQAQCAPSLFPRRVGALHR